MVYDSWLAAVRESNHKSQIVNSKSKSPAVYSDPMGVAALRRRLPTPPRPPALGELALFRMIGPAAGSAPAGPRKLALFCRSLLHVRFTITPFLQGTCPSRRSGGNWLCFAQLLPVGVSRPPAPIPGRPRQIGFVSHDLPSRERRSPDRHKGEIGFVCTTTTGEAGGTKGEGGTSRRQRRKLALFFEPIRRLNATQLFSCKRLSFDFAPTEIGFVSHESPGDRGAASGVRSLTPDP
jgi:hypothetical protein